MKTFPKDVQKILIRSTNWIGDAVMTTPAIRSIRQNYPKAEITLLALPWVADVFSASPHIDKIFIYDKNGRHGGIKGKIVLAGDLRGKGYNVAILLQNAFEAAFITMLARIPVRAGYTTDGRGLLLTHGVKKNEDIKLRHQVYYYQEMLQGLGLQLGPDELELPLADKDVFWATNTINQYTAGQKATIVGINPGAAYGPAKCWPAEKYADLAKQLCLKQGVIIVVFGTKADRVAAIQIQNAVNSQVNMIDLTGKTTLGQALGMISLCNVFVTNDSGLMHVSAALKVPTVAIFGSTDHIATGPYSENASIVRTELDCSPCLKTHCPKKHFRCMEDIGIDDVVQAIYTHLEMETEV